jgi:ribosomal-protein-alanine N-acetyltransferase
MVSGLTAAIEIGEQVFLRPPTAADEGEFLALMRASRRLHQPWVTPPLAPGPFAAYLQRLAQDNAAGFLVCRRDDGAIAGVINLNEIVRNAFQNAYLGYYVGAPFAGHGYMTEALRLTLHHAFATFRLHRLEANIQPGNQASIALVQRCGFRREGFSPRYLKIAGEWRDHERWAVVLEDWLSSRSARRRAAG